MKKKAFGKQSRLGRGLDSLLGPSMPLGQEVLSLDIERILPNENQPRKYFPKQALEELSLSIAKHGLLQPLLVRPFGENYQIIAGERRWRAAGKAGLHKVPVIVRHPDSIEETLWALLENIQRSDLNPLEEAKAYKKLMREQGLTQEELAEALGRARTSIANQLRLLTLDSKVQEWLAKGQLNFSQAREILKEKLPQNQRQLARKCMGEKLTVRGLSRKLPSKKISPPVWIESSLLELRKSYDWNVHLDYRKGKGKLSFPFNSEKDLKNLLDKLWPKT